MTSTKARWTSGSLPMSLKEKITPDNKPKKVKKEKSIEKIIQDEKEAYRKQIFLNALAFYGISPVQEFLFAKDIFNRRWKSDYYFEKDGVKFAIEQEGGGGTGGRHTRFEGFREDMQKYNCYSALGITLLRFTPTQISTKPKEIAEIIFLALNKKDFTKQMKLIYK